MSSLGSMLGMTRTGITKMLWWSMLLDYVADGHGSVPSARHRRFPKGPAPVSDQEPLPIDDQVFPSFDLDPEDADADNPHREVELWGGWEGPDLVEDATIEVAGLEGLVDLLLGLPIWRVLAAGGEWWIEFHDSLLLDCSVGPGGRGLDPATRDTAAPIEK